jgi:hypothetical protein
MQKEFGKDGLVVMTVNIDDKEDDRRKAVKFLKDKAFPFVNWMIAPGEKQGDWEDTLKLEQFPSSFLYDREGKQVGHPQALEPKELEDKIKEQLSKK